MGAKEREFFGASPAPSWVPSARFREVKARPMTPVGGECSARAVKLV